MIDPVGPMVQQKVTNKIHVSTSLTSVNTIPEDVGLTVRHFRNKSSGCLDLDMQ